ncbi:MAG TPA: CYCXC family (seleno)protein [Terriglobia bacterium]|nr:CYCXC family (seleno)protein [Terriglobia bacterium]
MKSKTETKPGARSARSGTLLVIGAFFLMAGFIWISLHLSERPTSSPAPAAAPALVATLSPDLFAGKARAAYQVAKEIPEILQRLPCFCGCFGLGHQNNLYCFADNHGDACDECQEIALTAKEMHSKGLSIEQIIQAVRARFGPVP